jgi:hypothetical protein
MITIEPVTIPREVADRIESLRSSERSNEYICELATRTGGAVPVATRDLHKISFDTLPTALVVGYERELTEEEKRKQAYSAVRAQYRKADDGWDDWDSGCTWAIEFVLNTLGIVIPGVNDTEVSANV